ncbi:MAG: hypothetical protein A2908_03540 [Candidatus Staskawiczbacteria bacterium RIFCSPLOWO2_01_FULL_38_12b]|uniref:Peptidase S11 D-alanyl-D-alanine carboxypeptidase A N-terminal domain-containing protein n=1 Tax=Candidatus Staskawiczbacteria bacterium RIFCSPLOWO2_01_FULL_38_12b TaxID=1802214 RepID=A0A1G2IDB4_9BACT|nr:MAG: hypothetical protein A2908_03540 [Candidatus Staskawiczbacteria bacterium RIFCSPLOWO2_01_FULL_38_12b]
MKYKPWLILVIALLLVSPAGGFALAAEVSGSFILDQPAQQIKALQTQIQNLKQLIAKLLLQKKIASESYIVVDISDNSVIAQKNSNQAYPIASITKLMNAVVTLENINMDDTITLNPQMLKPEGYSPSLFLHLTVSAKNLLQASLIQSTNDASEALSYFVGNTKFVDLMNQKAKDIGMQNTYFYDAYGLSPHNRSTALDLSKLLAYIYNHHSEILTITKENDFWLPDETGKLLKFQNVNNLYAYPEFIGAKSGYIPKSKQTLASVANINGKPIAIVLLRSANRKTEALNIVDWLKNIHIYENSN